MDALAYTYSYATHEGVAPFDYDCWNGKTSNLKTLSHLVWFSALSVTLFGSILSLAAPGMAQALVRGMEGEAVAEVQTLLRNRGYSILYGSDGAGRGKFGPQTEQAVRAFQANVGLTPDGVVGPNTMTALRGGIGGSETPTPTAPSHVPNGMLGLGSQGAAVSEVQTLLRNRGYSIPYGSNGSSRGVFDEATLAAVRQFQAENGLTVDGVVGPQTMAALRGNNNTTQRTTPSQAAAPIIGEQGTYLVVTNGNRLNVRSGPGTKYSVVRSLPDGVSVNVVGFANPYWAEIAPGQYIATGFIRQR